MLYPIALGLVVVGRVRIIDHETENHLAMLGLSRQD